MTLERMEKRRIAVLHVAIFVGVFSMAIRPAHAFLYCRSWIRPTRFSVAVGFPQQQHQKRCNSRFYAGTSSEEENFLDNLGKLLERREEKQKLDAAQRSVRKYDGWRIIDWKTDFSERPLSSPSSGQDPSPVDRVLVRNRLVHLKRDDQLKLSSRKDDGGGAPISGNKARKMIALNDIDSADFPSCVVSFGGPQSNAMLALAAIVHFQNQKAVAAQDGDDLSLDNAKNGATGDNNADAKDRPPPLPIKRFVYYTKKLPRFLRNQPNGNLFRAQTLGMELIELSTEEYANLFGGEWGGPTEPPAMDPPVPGDSLWVPQGGACEMALRGTRELANEIVSYWAKHGKGGPLTICVPGGTCSTAALVDGAIQDILVDAGDDMDIRVVVIPCVGDEKYAQRQMMSLRRDTQGEDSPLVDIIPTVMPPAPDGPRYFGQAIADDSNYFRFGEPSESILATFREMKENYGITLDLLYGAPSWTILLRHFRTEPNASGEAISSFDPRAPLAGREIMYVHSGGLEGINSQLMRYKYKGLIDSEEVQLPGRR